MPHRLLEDFGPRYTPKAVSMLITVTSLISLFSALGDGLLRHLSGLPGIETFLSLSLWGIHQGFFWQPLTYLLMVPNHELGVTFGMILSLLFQMYLLWIAGTALCERTGPSPFLRLYLISGLLAGLAALVVMATTGYVGAIAGPWPALLAILVAWAMLYPDTQMLLFLTIPVKTMWMIFGYLAIILLIDLSQSSWVDLTINVVAAGTAYLYAIVAWGFTSPFSLTHSFDRRLHQLGNSIHSRFFERDTSSKIVHLFGKKDAQDDDEFLEEMLTKISDKGENSLSWRERRRLNKISKTRRK